ncbi:ABC transporter ATP-binding protein [Ornithinimicrobium murale]|uniref:ABC transporter ATP-binding protein n=1 Tax=Ornithinimicrobium murale TaxID=1050153 RepID=UPI000E0DE5D0|nr:ABC transporter ATP-binding protein [Ornithinimicrobium murale]
MSTGPTLRAPVQQADRGPDVAVRLDSVSKVFRRGGEVRALDGVSLSVPRGAFLAVMGRSGSGKSTLLHVAAGLDVPSSGSVWIGGTEVSRLRETPRTRFRRDRVGFVFQAYNLVPSLTIEENITLPLRLAGANLDRAWVGTLVERTGLVDLLRRLPGELSGGQQQRVAIARALAPRPAVVFADEPTGALDLATGQGVLGLLREMVSDYGQTVVMVTHDPVAAASAHDTVVMADGRIREVLRAPDVEVLADQRRPPEPHTVGAHR